MSDFIFDSLINEIKIRLTFAIGMCSIQFLKYGSISFLLHGHSLMKERRLI